MNYTQKGEIGTIIAITTFVILSVATAVTSFIAQNTSEPIATTETRANSCVVGKTLCDIPACNATLGGDPAKCPACNGGWCNGGVCGTCGKETPKDPLPPPRNAPTATKAPPESCTPEGRKKGSYCDNFTTPGTCFFVDTVCGANGEETYAPRQNDRCDCNTGQAISGGGNSGEGQPTSPPAQPTQRPVATSRPDPTSAPQPTDRVEEPQPTDPPSGGRNEDPASATPRPSSSPRATRTPTPRVSRVPSATPQVSTTPRLSVSPTRAPAGNEPTSTPGPTPKICENRYRCMSSCGAIADRVQGQVCSPGAVCCNYKSSTVLEIYNWMEKDLILKNICVRNLFACGDSSDSLIGTKDFTVQKRNGKGPFIETDLLHKQCYNAEKDEVDVNKTITIQIDYKTKDADGEESILRQEFQDISCANKHGIVLFGRQ